MNRKFRILHTEAATGWGGQEIRILQESLWLAERGHKVFILCALKSNIYQRFSQRKIPNLSFHTLPFKRTLDPMDILRTYQLIRRENIDIVHTHSSIDSWTASIAAKLARIPIARSRHVSIPAKDFFPRNLVYRFPGKIIASGEKIAGMMTTLKTVSADKVVSIPAGVNLKRFRPDICGSRVREEFQVPGDAPLIGKVAIIRGWKGHIDFINAAEIVLKKHPVSFFMIVGSGPGFENTKKIIKEKKLDDKIIMTGFREDIPEILNALDILVLASRSGEATSQVIPQAWACKRCILATKAGGIADIVRNNKNGILIPPNAPERMAEELNKLIENPELRIHLAEAGYEYLLQNLTEEGMMEKTLSVYKDLAGS